MISRKYFYDTEFIDNGSTIELISIGIVCQDGREYYAVNSDFNLKQITDEPHSFDWIVDNVLPGLPATKHNRDRLKVYMDRQRNLAPGPNLKYFELNMKSTKMKPKWVIANEVREFIVGGIVEHVIVDDQGKEVERVTNPAERPELWAYYSAYDHVALAQLYGPMISLPKFMPMWTHDLMQLAENLPKDQWPEKPADEHNALADARWNLALYRACVEIS